MAMSMTMMKQAIQLNDRGVDCLECYDFKKAAQYFSTCLQLIAIDDENEKSGEYNTTSCLTMTEQNNNDEFIIPNDDNETFNIEIDCYYHDDNVTTTTPAETCCSATPSSASSPPSSSYPSTEMEPTKPTMMIISGADELFVYQTPVRVSAQDVEKEVNNLTVAVLFNFALTHHLRAIMVQVTNDNDGSSSNKKKRISKSRLRAALKLYELGFMMQLNGEVCLSLSHTMALVNNCGHIQHELRREKKAERYFQQLLTALMYTVQCGDASDVDDFEGFFQNASKYIILLNPEVAAAA